MIVGVGVDILNLNRFEKLIQKPKFMEKIFTKKELAFIDGRSSKAASNFSAKEAISKISKRGLASCKPSEMEILRDENGAPFVNLYGRTRELFCNLGVDKIHLSISNTDEMVIAYAVGEGGIYVYSKCK